VFGNRLESFEEAECFQYASADGEVVEYDLVSIFHLHNFTCDDLE
jgi:hypothetical protein